MVYDGTSFRFCLALCNFSSLLVLICLTVSVPAKYYPDKTAISSDSVVSMFLTMLTEHKTDIKARSHDSLLSSFFFFPRHVQVRWWTGREERKGQSYLWKAGCNNSVLAQETLTPHCRLSGIQDVQSMKCGGEKGEQDNVCQLIKDTVRIGGWECSFNIRCLLATCTLLLPQIKAVSICVYTFACVSTCLYLINQI